MKTYMMLGLTLIYLFGFSSVSSADTLTKNIGIVIFDGVLISEVTAPAEVFAPGYGEEEPKVRFNVQLIAESTDVVKTHEGLRILPDATFDDEPPLDILIVPSSFNLEASEKNANVVNFVRQQGTKAEYLASNCAGAFIVGEAGLLKDKKVVTYVGGGEYLQERFPEALVQDDSKHTVVVDGNYISSNGALVSYASAFKLLEMISGKEAADSRKAELFYDQLVN